MSPSTRTLLAAASTLAAAACLTGFAGSASASTPSPTPSAKAAACDKTPWEAMVQGAPTNFHPGGAGGDYLWHDSTGFHLRVTHRSNDRAVYSGVITSPTPMRKDAVRLEGSDVAALSSDRKTLVFRFANYGHVDGMNFHTDCASHITLSRLYVGTAHLPANRVYLGSKEAHPAHIPFALTRQPASAS